MFGTSGSKKDKAARADKHGKPGGVKARPKPKKRPAPAKIAKRVFR